MNGLLRRYEEARGTEEIFLFGRFNLKRLLTGILMLALMNVPAFAQQSSPPIIPFTRCRIRSSFPTGCISARQPRWPSIPRVTSSCSRAATPTGPAYAATAAQLLEFDQNGKYLREIGHDLYAWSFAHGGGDRPGRQHLGCRQGLGHGREVYAERPRRDGVRPQTRSLRRRHGPAQASEAAAAAGERPLPPSHRHRVR